MKLFYSLTVLFIFSLSTYSYTQIPTDGLVAHYTFDGDAIDQSGNGNDGTENGGVTYTTDRFGNANGAANFDGVDDYVSGIDLTSSFTVGNPISISVWFKLDNYQGSSNMLITGGDPGNGPDFQSLLTPGTVGYSLQARLYGGNPDASIDTEIVDNDWHHMTWGTDGATSFLFLDGSLQAEMPTIGTMNRDILTFGGRLASPENFFDGALDDIRIYNLALSESEISELYGENNYHPGFIEVLGVILEELSEGSSDWGDFDNDGDYDLLLAGYNNNGQTVSRIFRNDNGEFIEGFIGQLEDVRSGNVIWGDYDNDDDLDVLLTGTNGAIGVTKIFENTGTEFIEVFADTFLGLYASCAEWLDIDQDGDLDVFLSGYNNIGGVIGHTLIYEKTSTGFRLNQSDLVGVQQGSLDVGDYNNDGDIDILLSGEKSDYSKFTGVYQNSNAEFSEEFIGQLEDVEKGSVKLVDFDSDSDLDLLITGYNGEGNFSGIYENNGVGFIERPDINIQNVSESTSQMADLNGDGTLDLILSGSGSQYTKIYVTSEMQFVDSFLELIPGVYDGEIDVVDFDNDGDLDLFISGITTDSDERLTKLYKNQSLTPNTAPQAPTNLQTTTQTNGDINFTWDAATDNETPSLGLSYDIYVGTDPGVYNRTPGKADPATGFRRIVERGSLQTTFWNMRGLENGTYYWSVQAVDAGFMGSPFATEGTFTIDVTAPESPVALLSSGETSTSFTANWETRTDISTYILDVAKDADFTDFVTGYESREIYGVGSLEVTGVNQDTVYYYRLRAENAGGLSGYCNTIAAYNTLSISSLDQYLGAPGDERTIFGSGFATETFYNTVFFRHPEPIEGEEGVYAQISDVNTDGTEVSFIIPDGVTNGATITLESFGLSADAPQTFSLTTYTSPTGLTASITGTAATLSWDAHPDAAAETYNIYRGTSPNPTTYHANTTQTTYDDAGLSEGTNYYYRITATDGSNETGYSNEVSVAVQNSTGTDVSGNLIESDTWTIAGSPYNIVGDVGVPAAYSLTIEPGVVINYTGDFRILVFGSIQVNGNESNPITFNGNSTEGSKYMIEIRKTNLDNSNIDYAVMKGPQGAILQGLEGDTEQNIGNLVITGISIKNSKVFSHHGLEHFSAAGIVTACWFNASSFENSYAYGSAFSLEQYPIVFSNSFITQSEFDVVNLKLIQSVVESTNIAFSNYMEFFEMSGSQVHNSTVGTGELNVLKSSNSVITGTKLIVNNETEIANSIFARIESNSSTQLTLGFRSNIISETSFIGNSLITALSFYSGDTYSSTLNNVLIDGNLKGIGINANNQGSLNVTGSNFINTYQYHIENLSIETIVAQSNYWDSNSASIIASKIYDSGDDLELGTVDFSNRLATHNLNAPISSPKNVVLSDDGAGGVNVSWAANEEADVAGYKLYYKSPFEGGEGDVGGIWYLADHITIDAGNVTTYNIAGLSITDSVAVTAYDADVDDVRDMTDGNESWYSFAVTPPDAPIAAEVDSITVNSFLATWSVVSDASSYRLDVATDDQFANILSGYNNLLVNDTVQNVDGLTANTTYYFRVMAENAAGISSNSNTISIRTLLFELGESLDVSGFLLWGDIDNDNDLDLVSIFNSGVRITRNNGNGTFAAQETSGITGAENHHFEFTDYDNDGDIDLIIVGRSSGEGRVAKLYQNDGTGTFTELSDLPFVPTDFGGYVWGDYDNNGSQDLMIVGEPGSGRVSNLYKNNLDGTFSEVESSVLTDIEGDIAGGGIDWLDYDKDGDLDLLLTSHNYSTKLLTNEADTFQNNISNSFVQIEYGDISIADYNNDGYLDITLIGGEINEIKVSRVYLNNKDGNYIEQTPTLPGYNSDVMIETIDYNNDGMPDFYVYGSNESDVREPDLYKNSDGISFEPDQEEFFDKINATYLGWADYDNDGDIDFAINSGVYLNAAISQNTTPNPPSNLSSSVAGTQVNFTWDKATDVETPQDGLNYNIYIGTAPGTQNIRSAHADLNTGFRRIVKRGDIQGNSWFIKGLAPGTYYWSVQAIDASYAGGAFAEEQSFTVTENQAPTISDQTFSIDENSAVSTVVGTVVASDADSDALTYSIVSGNTGDAFVIGSTSGELAVQSSSALDFETTPSFSLTVEVSDGTVSSSATITVNINDVDESTNTAPTISDQTFSIDENSSVSTVVGTVVASDADSDALTYSIVSGNTGDAFAIGSTSGELAVQSSSALDFETTPSFSLTVEVSDGTVSSSATITVNLNDVDESTNTAPTISDQTFSIDENSAVSTVVGTVVASDADTDALTYSIVSGNTGDAFAIGSTSGELAVQSSNALDFETTPSFSLTVEVSDGTVSSSATITVNLNDVNEATNTAPTDIYLSSVSVLENQAVGTSVGFFGTEDSDSGDSHSYALISGIGDSDNESFVIVGSELQTNEVFDAAVKNEYSIRVQTSDAAGATFSKVFSINVLDESSGQASISVSGVTVNEADGFADIVVSISAAVNEDVSVTVSTVDGVATESGGDFIFKSQVVTFPANTTTDQMFSISITDDNRVESNETFSVNMTDLTQSSTNLLSLSNTTATVTITDNDAAIISIADVTINEAAGSVSLAISMDNPVDEDVTFTARTIQGTARNVDDYERVSGVTYTIDEGELLPTTIVPITIVDDNLVEETETFEYELSAITSLKNVRFTGGTGTTAATVTITDADAAVISISDAEVSEGDGVMTFTVSMSAPVDEAVSVYASTTAVEATSTSDYTTVSGSQITFAAGSNTNKTISVSITDNSIVEAVETFIMTLANIEPASGKNISFVNDAVTVVGTGTINDDDVATISIDDVSLNEGASGTSDFIFSATLSGLVDQSVDVSYSTNSVTASSGIDYIEKSGTITFAGNSETSLETQMITVSVNGDMDLETDEVFEVILNNVLVNGKNVGIADAIGLGTILNDDGELNDDATLSDLKIEGTTIEGFSSAITEYIYDVAIGTTIVPKASATSTDPNANVQITDSPVITDDTQIEVTAQDGITQKIYTISFNQVNNTNNPPSILDQTFSIDENSAATTIVGAIVASDADQDALTYSLSSSGNTDNAFGIDATTGELSVQTSSAINFEENPSFSLSVSVSDGEEDSSSATITVNVTDLNDEAVFGSPEAPVNYTPGSGGFTASIEVTDEDGISQVFIDHKKAGHADYTSAQLNESGGKYSFEMTDNNLDNVGVQYRFRAVDTDGNSAETLPSITYTEVAANASTVQPSGGAGKSIKNYSLIAFPFDSPNADQLLSELGSYNDNTWKLYKFNTSSSQYQEYKKFSSVAPGEGYWFITSSTEQISVGGRAVEVEDGSFVINLNSGFNLIGNPFQGTLDWNATVQHNVNEGIITISDLDNATQSQLYTWNGAYVEKSTLDEFEGGFVKTNKAIADFEIPLTALSGGGGRSVHELPSSKFVDIDKSDWELGLYFKSPSYDYYLAGIGLDKSASDLLDDYDRESLPRFVVFLDAKFELGVTKSIKKTDDFKSWKFTIPNNLTESSIELSWDHPESESKTLMLLDGKSRKLVDLQSLSTHNLSSDPSVEHNIFFGNKDEIYSKMDLPFDIMFEVFPNPAHDYLKLTFYAADNKTSKIDLISMDGRTVYSKSVDLRKGLNKCELNLTQEQIPEGIYLVKFDNTVMTKFIKR